MIYQLLAVGSLANGMRVGIDSYNKCVLEQEQAKDKTCPNVCKLDEIQGESWLFTGLMNNFAEETNKASCDELIITQQKSCINEFIKCSALIFISSELGGLAGIALAQGVGYVILEVASVIPEAIEWVH